MWADVSWGRYWSWDAKEIWALISLLVYMIILHARHCGWSSPFSLSSGAVFGFLGILWTWYGVNFVMTVGRHSYGQGDGGKLAILAILGATNLLFLAAAAVRYLIDTREPCESTDSDQKS